LEEPFGLTGRTLTASKPFGKKSENCDSWKENSSSSPIVKKETAKVPVIQDTKGKINPFIIPSKSEDKQSSSPKVSIPDKPLIIESQKRIPGRGRGQGALLRDVKPFPAANLKNTTQQFAKDKPSQRGTKRSPKDSHPSRPQAPPPTGIFSHTNGFTEAYGETIAASGSLYGTSVRTSMTETLELGGKGHFHNKSGMVPVAGSQGLSQFPSSSYQSSMGIGLPMGRGRGRRPAQMFDLQPGMPMSYQMNPHHPHPFIEPVISVPMPLAPCNKILRDPLRPPLVEYYGEEREVPVYRGSGFSGASKPKAKNPTRQKSETKSQKVRLDGNVEVSL
jgi:hypothetical protein